MILYCILFPKRKEIFVNDFDDQTTISSSEIAQIIFKNIQDADRITTKEQIVEELMSGGSFCNEQSFADYSEVTTMIKDFYKTYGPNAKAEDYPDAWNKIKNLSSAILEKYYKIKEEKARELVDQQWSQFDGCNIFVLDYEDNNWVDSLIERGEVFLRIPYLSISHH